MRSGYTQFADEAPERARGGKHSPVTVAPRKGDEPAKP
jgi:hypothetical protein